jgi:hypothetical protein
MAASSMSRISNFVSQIGFVVIRINVLMKIRPRYSQGVFSLIRPEA